MTQTLSDYSLPSIARAIKGKAEETLLVEDLPDPRENLPDIVTWATEPEYLGRRIFPKQATFLKLIFLGVDQHGADIFTEYDYDVLDQWQKRWEQTGEYGIQPDWEERIAINRAQGRRWFREVLAIVGRRGSKGFIGAICGSYILANFLVHYNPQEFYGVDAGKRIEGLVFSGKKESAKDNLWRDINTMVTNSPYFRQPPQRVSKSLGTSFTVNSDRDLDRIKLLRAAGLKTELDVATFVIAAKETTQMAGRGPTSFMQFYDEMAHVVSTTAHANAEDVYKAAKPSVMQFGEDAFIYEPSSPWQKMGQFYTNFENSLKRVAEDGFTDGDAKPAHPEMLMLKLESWCLYEDWEGTYQKNGKTIPIMYLPPVCDDKGDALAEQPGLHGAPFEPHELDQVVIWKDHPDLKSEELANPETFGVEFRARWAAALSAYLDEGKIKKLWDPFQGSELVQLSEGALGTHYIAHGDPSKSGANFGFAIAHMVEIPGAELPHVVFDRLHAWRPSDYADPDPESNEKPQIDYMAVERDIIVWMRGFMPSQITFDQFNNVMMMQRLDAVGATLPKRVTAFEEPATHPLNWRIYETFKTALNMELVHAPYFELAELELTFLQNIHNDKVDHPTSGPVQTKDVADCMARCVYNLLGQRIAALLGARMSSMGVGGAMQGGMPPAASTMSEMDRINQQFSNFAAGRRGRRGTGGMGRMR